MRSTSTAALLKMPPTPGTPVAAGPSVDRCGLAACGEEAARDCQRAAISTLRDPTGRSGEAGPAARSPAPTIARPGREARSCCAVLRARRAPPGCAPRRGPVKLGQPSGDRTQGDEAHVHRPDPALPRPAGRATGTSTISHGKDRAPARCTQGHPRLPLQHVRDLYNIIGGPEGRRCKPTHLCGMVLALLLRSCSRPPSLARASARLSHGGGHLARVEPAGWTEAVSRDLLT